MNFQISIQGPSDKILLAKDSLSGYQLKTDYPEVVVFDATMSKEEVLQLLLSFGDVFCTASAQDDEITYYLATQNGTILTELETPHTPQYKFELLIQKREKARIDRRILEEQLKNIPSPQQLESERGEPSDFISEGESSQEPIFKTEQLLIVTPDFVVEKTSGDVDGLEKEKLRISNLPTDPVGNEVPQSGELYFEVGSLRQENFTQEQQESAEQKLLKPKVVPLPKVFVDSPKKPS